jgi:2-methylisocitrate lyase-like PEP mutase family enzyme
VIRPTEALRSLIDAGTPFMAADCYSALTGRIIEQAGFDAAYMGAGRCGSSSSGGPPRKSPPTRWPGSARRRSS